MSSSSSLRWMIDRPSAGASHLGACSLMCAGMILATLNGGYEPDARPSARVVRPKHWCVHCAFCGRRACLPESGDCRLHGSDCPEWLAIGSHLALCAYGIVSARAAQEGCAWLPPRAVAELERLADVLAGCGQLTVTRLADELWERRTDWMPIPPASSWTA